MSDTPIVTTDETATVAPVATPDPMTPTPSPVPAPQIDQMQSVNDGTGNLATSADPASAQTAFQEAVEAAARRMVAQNQAATDQAAGDTAPTHTIHDYNTDEYYGGLISPELITAFDGIKRGKKALFAQLRSVLTDQFGTRSDIWFPAKELDIAGPRPGEHRLVYLVPVGDDD